MTPSLITNPIIMALNENDLEEIPDIEFKIMITMFK